MQEGVGGKEGKGEREKREEGGRRKEKSTGGVRRKRRQVRERTGRG